MMQSELLFAVLLLTSQTGADEGYLRWSATHAETTGNSTHKSGKVGPWNRGFKTDTALRYSLRVTWFTPDVLRASARLLQVRSRLTDAATRQLVVAAESKGDTVFMVDIDPVEGSGVIPDSWQAFLQPAGVSLDSNAAVQGSKAPELRRLDVFQGVRRRNYEYDRYWVAFSLIKADGTPLFPAGSTSAELIVRIHDKEGKISFPIPESIRQKSQALSQQKTVISQ